LRTAHTVGCARRLAPYEVCAPNQAYDTHAVATGPSTVGNVRRGGWRVARCVSVGTGDVGGMGNGIAAEAVPGAAGTEAARHGSVTWSRRGRPVHATKPPRVALRTSQPMACVPRRARQAGVEVDRHCGPCRRQRGAATRRSVPVQPPCEHRALASGRPRAPVATASGNILRGSDKCPPAAPASLLPMP